MPRSCSFRWFVLALVWVGIAAKRQGCPGTEASLGDGRCDRENDNAECKYDGGDCCRCTCVDGLDFACGSNGFECRDPGALDELYGCRETAHVRRCSSSVPSKWVVKDLQSATSLAKALLCSGGTFSVEWHGAVSIEHTISVAHGTTLEVTGIPGDKNEASIDGGGSMRLFTVMNSTLYLSNVHVRGGFANVGGAIASSGSSLYLKQTSFRDNVAVGDGGAVFMRDNSRVSWSGRTSFERNHAGLSGGALYAQGDSVVTSSGKTDFSDNAARSTGGAVSLQAGSRASWDAPMDFARNKASSGGALHVVRSSSVSWAANTAFSANSADVSGGAVFISSGSGVSWTVDTFFVENTAGENGGGVYAHGGREWTLPSTLSMGGTTKFSANSVLGSGGGMALVGSVSVSFSAKHVIFVANFARHAGGALSVSNMGGNGGQICGVLFEGNQADLGAGVFVADSSAAVSEEDGRQVGNPINFKRCKFVGNVALESGGALGSWMAPTLMTNCYFERNAATRGGALHLAGASSVQNCSFVENTSVGNEGPAVLTRTGQKVSVSTSRFVDNTYECEEGHFLEYVPRGKRSKSSWIYPINFGHQGSPSCEGCSLPPKMPMCSPALEHTSTPHRTMGSKIGTLKVDAGYWRESKRSKDILPCYHAEACRGGVTGAVDYCMDGYEGPYCAVCSHGYRAKPDFKCEKCPDKSAAAVVAALGVMAILVVVVLVPVALLGWEPGASDGRALRVWKSLERQWHSLKIAIVAWQVLSQFSSAAHVVYPPFYQHFVDFIGIFNFDIGWTLNTWCLVDVGFHERLLVATIGPLVAWVVLAAIKEVCIRVHQRSEAALRKICRGYWSLVVLVTFLVYSPVSFTLFETFPCDELNDGKRYLKADHRIECDSPAHIAFRNYARCMIVPYTMGIPVLYGVLLMRTRTVLADGHARETDVLTKAVLSLWRLYKPRRFYFELIECLRRLCFTGILTFVLHEVTEQLAAGIVLSVVFLCVMEALDPYESRLDLWASRTGHAVVCISMFWALMLDVNADKEWVVNQAKVEWMLVVLNVGMVFAVALSVFFFPHPSGQDVSEDMGGGYRRLPTVMATEAEADYASDGVAGDEDAKESSTMSSAEQLARRR